MKLLVLFLGAIAINDASHWSKFKRNAEEQRILNDSSENRVQNNFAAINASLPAVDPYSINEEAGRSEYLYDENIHLTEEQLNAFERQLEEVDEHGRSKRQVSMANKWTNNQVFYYFQPQTSDGVKAVVKYATAFIQSKTCVTFRESSTATNRIMVYIGKNCSSWIGMATGEQKLSLGTGCTISGTVFHEFFHALGINHMQRRSDRDRYITVNLGAIKEERKFSFDKLAANEEINYTPYEYGSVMHYGAKYSLKDNLKDNGFSMVTKDPAYMYTIGGSIPSFYDFDMINQHYKCYDRCPKSSNCKNGGKPNPANCNVCNCPAGYGGNYCDQRPSGCGETLTATSAWKSQTVKIGNTASQGGDIPAMCNYWVTAPSGYKVELKLTDVDSIQCQYGCKFVGVEFKTNEILATNPRICCSEFFNKSYVSKLNPTPVILYNYLPHSTFTFSYRTVPGSAEEVAPRTPTD